MKQRTTFETVLETIDCILEIPSNATSSARRSWQKLDSMLEEMLDAAKIDMAYHKRMNKLVTFLRAAASKFNQSLLSSKHGGPLHGDWLRFAERDFLNLKDELLALREFFVEEADFLRFACLRAHLREIGKADPEKLFKELHEAGAISERTWVLLMSRPDSWRKVIKDRELSKQLAQISGWLLELQEARKGQTENVRKTLQ